LLQNDNNSNNYNNINNSTAHIYTYARKVRKQVTFKVLANTATAM